MKHLSLIAASLLLATSAANARDARLVHRHYNPNEVVRIEGQAGVQASIAFGDDERIENVAIGDSTSWQVTPNKRANILFIKPLNMRARTNLTVVTDQHKYFFDLVARSDARPLYVLQFIYPEKPKLASSAETPKALSAEETQLAGGEPKVMPIDPATVNQAWYPRGDTKLFPSRIYDDGQSTYLSWPKSAAIPAILIRDEKGKEGPVNFSVHDDVTIVDGVPALFVLRSGKDMAILENRGKPRTSESSNTVLSGKTALLQEDQ